MSKNLIYLVCFVLVLSMAHQTSADLILHWSFDEGSGDVVNDSSGNGHVGTIEGATWVVSERGPCLEFGGDGDRVVDENGPDYLIHTALGHSETEFLPFLAAECKYVPNQPAEAPALGDHYVKVPSRLLVLLGDFLLQKFRVHSYVG